MLIETNTVRGGQKMKLKKMIQILLVMIVLSTGTVSHAMEPRIQIHAEKREIYDYAGYGSD